MCWELILTLCVPGAIYARNSMLTRICPDAEDDLTSHQRIPEGHYIAPGLLFHRSPNFI